MAQKLTIIVSEVDGEELVAGYAAAAADAAAEAEAAEWTAADLGEALPEEDFRDWPCRPVG